MKLTKTVAKERLMLTLSTLLTAAGIYLFKLPNNFPTGSVSGIAVVLGHSFPETTPGDFVMVINVALLVDMVLKNIRTHKYFHIITTHPAEIETFITQSFHRGATELHGEAHIPMRAARCC